MVAGLPGHHGVSAAPAVRLALRCARDPATTPRPDTVVECVWAKPENRGERPIVARSHLLHHTLICIQRLTRVCLEYTDEIKLSVLHLISQHLNYSVKPMMQLCISYYPPPFAAVLSFL